MAAPIDSKYSLSKKSLKFILTSNFTSSLIVLSLVYVPYNGKSPLDIVYNCLTATKIMSALLWILNIVISHANKSGNERLKEHFKLIPSLKKGALMYLSNILLAYFITVLYGAPLTETVSETFHFALILATASVAPGIIHLGVNTDTWVRIFAMNRPETAMERVVQFTTISSIVGGWLGAVPIPLDWDRPWQVWPITCVLGTVLGYVAGLLGSSVYLGYQYYKLNKLKST